MKVTVYFGNVRVIVPCGQGDILVRELMDLAITRYKKATGKSQSSVVIIHNLKSSRDDGILYPDDRLNDVADDREQIIAEFEENYSLLPQSNCGDVTSTSSVCTGSPDLFSVEVGSHCSIVYNPSDVEITEDPHPLGVMPLQVRRGSEPALNCLFPVSPTTDPNKRWSTAVVINTADNRDSSPDIMENGIDDQYNGREDQYVSAQESCETNGESKTSSVGFFRGSGRLSILGNNAETYRWVEAADRQLIKDFNENFTLKPISFENCDADAGSDTSSMSDERERTVILKNESGPLGIHVVPDYDSKGRDTGLVIQGIEPGGRIDRDGRFHAGDRITEINGKSLQNVNFQTAQEIFKNALKSPQIKLELVRGNNHSRSKTAAIPKKPPPPVYPKPNVAEPQKKSDEEAALVEGEERAGGVSTKVATVTPTKKVPPSATRRLASANTRRIGRMLTIELTKGSSGLGFSITTRDNPAGGNSPIYIKNVLPEGAAIEDGRLQPGDRLLEVNNIPMTGKTQAEAVTILRNIPLGNAVQLIVSRQEMEDSEQTENENESTSSKLDEEAGIFPWKNREILTFQIPLNDSHSAGLGVSVKGQDTSSAEGTSRDLGIFIKSVIPGGAASKDGRLRIGDQLVNINGISLLGMCNSNAMETLRNAMMQSDGPIRNAIILTIARRIFQPSEVEDNDTPQKIGESPSSEKVKPSVETSDAKDRFRNFPTNISRTSQIIAELDGTHNGASLPGCNPVIERLTGQVSTDYLKSSSHDIYGYSKQDSKHSLNDSNKAYSATISSSQNETVIIEGEYDPSAKKLDDSSQKLSNGLSDAINVAPAGSQLSLDESNPGFARDGFGRQSMSEKRHAQLDARNTDTYQRTKKAREDKDRHQQELDDEYLPSQGTNPASSAAKTSESEEAVGPSLGLRKSSSLESLQTMIQELNKDDEAMKRAYQSGTSRSSRSRGCNESFRAAVDRSYDAPSSSTMETLDEESETGSSVGHVLARSTELPDANQNISTDPFQEELLSMYCRNSKSSKKKSLLKGLGSVFKFGKNRKHSQDLKSKDDDSVQEDAFHSASSNKDQDRAFDSLSKESDVQKRQLPQIPVQANSASSIDCIPNRQERMQSLREQHQRMHQKRQGHYPLDQKEEYYENELKEKESKYAHPGDVIHGRSHSLDIYKESAPNVKIPAFTGETNRYSHYMNYKEIQQHINQRVHHDHIRSSTSKVKSDSKLLSSSVTDCPPANFLDYESMHHLQRHTSSQSSDISCNSLPRTSRATDQALVHTQAPVNQPYFMHDSHDHGNYGHMNVHHFYPNNKLYSHIIPGSKV